MAAVENLIATKSYAFALRVVGLAKFLREQKEFILSNQVLRSGTSIGANVAEASGAQSRKEFRAKMSIAHKEIRETNFWLQLLQDAGYLEARLATSLLADCEELARITGKILTTAATRLAQKH